MRKTTSVTAKTNRKPVHKVAPPREVAPLDPTRILVRELMRTEVLTLRPDDSLHAAAEQLPTSPAASTSPPTKAS